MTGSGTVADPYVIWDVTDLQNMNLDLTAYYELGQDIDATITNTWNAGAGFIPIGQDEPLHLPVNRFSGFFDGKGHEITNLFINRPADSDGVGLLGTTRQDSTGYIRNVGLVDVDITGEGNVGSLVGFHEYMLDLADGIISDCWATGIVKGEDVLVAGLIGYNGGLVEDCRTACDVVLTGNVARVRQNGGFVGLNDRVIRRSFATGNITCNHQIGADIQEIGPFVGYNNNGDIDECFSTGNVLINNLGVALDDIWAIGGFIGDNWGNGIRNCYSRGNVTVTPGTGTAQGVGGLIGYNEAECENSYSTGLVTAPGFTRVGGLVGFNDDVVTDSFWDTETSGWATSEGGTGRTTAQMKASATFIAAGWDFGAEWGMTPPCNDGYPCLLDVTGSCKWVPHLGNINIDQLIYQHAERMRR